MTGGGQPGPNLVASQPLGILQRPGEAWRGPNARSEGHRSSERKETQRDPAYCAEQSLIVVTCAIEC